MLFDVPHFVYSPVDVRFMSCCRERPPPSFQVDTFSFFLGIDLGAELLGRRVTPRLTF